MGLHLKLIAKDELEAGGKRYRCAVGKQGITVAESKREGDGKTPAGTYRLRECWYRPDKMAAPVTKLPLRAISQRDGWCDAPAHECYNRPVLLPFEASHEVLWREDEAYNLIIPIGYNDDPVVAGKGSAIFLHVAQPDYRGTEGCVVLAQADWLEILPYLDTDSVIEIPVELCQ